MMFLTKTVWFCNYIYILCWFYSSTITVVTGTYRPNTVGLNRPCGDNLRISILTNPGLGRVHAPFYDATSNSVFFHNALASGVYRYFIDSRQCYNITLGTKDVSLIIPIEDTIDEYLVSYGSDLAILKWDIRTGKASFRTLGLSDPHHPYPQYIYVDVKVGRTQSKPVFFYSATRRQLSNSTGRSSLLDLSNGKKQALVSGLNRGLGIGFSKDGKTIFYNDGYRNRTFSGCYNEECNRIENVKIILNYPDLGISGRPESITVDSEGYLWIANEANRILKLNPYNGNVECSIKLSAKSVSAFTFGKCPRARNDYLDCMYVVTGTGGVVGDITAWDGSLLLIEGVKSTGVLDYKVPLSSIYGPGPARSHYYN